MSKSTRSQTVVGGLIWGSLVLNFFSATFYANGILEGGLRKCVKDKTVDK